MSLLIKKTLIIIIFLPFAMLNFACQTSKDTSDEGNKETPDITKSKEEQAISNERITEPLENILSLNNEIKEKENNIVAPNFIDQTSKNTSDEGNKEAPDITRTKEEQAITNEAIAEPLENSLPLKNSNNENKKQKNNNEKEKTLNEDETITQRDIVSIKVINSSSIQAKNQTITFGHVFVKGDFALNNTFFTYIKNAPAKHLPTQIDIKATHQDKTVRHAIITITLPSLQPNEPTEIILAISDADKNLSDDTLKMPDKLFGNVLINISGEKYRADLRNFTDDLNIKTWLSGPLVNESIVSIPLKNENGDTHPHLHLQTAIRHYSSLQPTSIDLTLENNWSYEPNPTNIIYDIDIFICGKKVLSKDQFTHYHHARWRKKFACGEETQVHIMHDSAYMASTGAIPNYDFSLTIPEKTNKSYNDSLSHKKFELMQVGLANKYMPATGAAPGIGPLPKWTAEFLISMSEATKKVTLETANLAGSWSIHYRDKHSNLPVSLDDYPKMTLKGNYNDTRNSSTGKYDAFPACAGDCKTPYKADGAHQPSFSYVPYLVTGDYFHLEELHFWANYNLFRSNPGFRDNEAGLLQWSQVRDQAWSFRTLAHAAFITPDNHPLKHYFRKKLDNNIQWYTNRYVTKNKPLGVITNGYAIVYFNKTGIAPWQDDFFTWAIGHSVALGFSSAKPLLNWKGQFPIARMINPDYCWIKASAYKLKIRNNKDSSLYNDINSVYQNNFPQLSQMRCNSTEMAEQLGLKQDEMVGYAHSPTGYPANLQIALAVLANHNVAGAKDAWNIFTSRKTKPNYENYPNFGLIPLPH